MQFSCQLTLLTAVCLLNEDDWLLSSIYVYLMQEQDQDFFLFFQMFISEFKNMQKRNCISSVLK